LTGDFTASVSTSFSGSGWTTVTGTLGASVSASLSGEATFPFTGELAASASVSFGGAGWTTATGELGASASVSFAGVGKLVFSGALGASVSPSMAATGGFTNRFAPKHIFPNWSSDGTSISFNIDEAPLMGDADDSRQILLGLLEAWNAHYETLIPQPNKISVLRAENLEYASTGNECVYHIVGVTVEGGEVEMADEP
jgi:hypothetical protein